MHFKQIKFIKGAWITVYYKMSNKIPNKTLYSFTTIKMDEWRHG
jgi:hypothetical protein